ncbi:alpha/beta-hydrolase [Neoconidiobolus thromboides FSU 785]|nr:alpha/beta-hydrolase [Neoconidiobolus thromboides FSU 785]
MFSNLKFSTPAEAKRISRFTAAAYCSSLTLKSWTCTHCKVLGPGIQVKHIFEDFITGGRGFLAVDEFKKQIILSFKGGGNIQNFIFGSNLLLTPFSVGNGGNNVYVQSGLKISLGALLPKFINEFGALLRGRDNYKIIITGYSLGAGIATLASIELKNAFNLSWGRMELYTYGGFRVGNVGFAQWFNAQPLTVARVVNNRDPVPHTPLRILGFAHYSNEVWLDNGKTVICKTNTLEDPDCSESKMPLFNILDHIFYYDFLFPQIC